MSETEEPVTPEAAPAFGDLPDGAACLTELPNGAVTWSELGEVPVGLDPEGVVVDRERGRAYVACSRSNAVAVVDLATMSRVK